MALTTSNAAALNIALIFEQIKLRGGHAAIDFKEGELILACTKPSPDTETWGRGAIPQKYTDGWVRLASC